MAGRRCARTPALPLPLPLARPRLRPERPAPLSAPAPAGGRRFLVLSGTGIGATATWALRFSPLVGRPGADALLIETTGLPEPEPALLARVLDAFARAGLPATGLLGAAPAALSALLRAGHPSAVLDPEAEAAALRHLPVTALAQPEATIAALHRLGLRDLAALEAQPRGPLARRFGPALLRELAALRGAIAPYTPIRPPPRHCAVRDFPEPLLTAPALAHALGGLVEGLCRGLADSGEGARQLRLTAFRGDGSVQEIAQGLGRASRDPAHVGGLLARRIEELRPGFGFERMALEAEVTEALAATQPGLAPGATPEEALPALLDRLAQRVEIWRPAPHASHWPERAQRRVSAFAPGQSFAPAPRPLRLLHPALPLEAVALLPDAPPSLLRLRGRAERVLAAEGPERIAPEWWRPGRQPPPRDYYRVQLASGARWWVCRRGAPGAADARWFLHGYLP